MGLEEEIADKKPEKSKEQRNVKNMGTHTQSRHSCASSTSIANSNTSFDITSIL